MSPSILLMLGIFINKTLLQVWSDQTRWGDSRPRCSQQIKRQKQSCRITSPNPVWVLQRAERECSKLSHVTALGIPERRTAKDHDG